jgi:glycosyltransferase involved in cell wall biosynthesis
MDLLLTGFPTPELEALVASRSLAGSVKFLGLVDELSLAALYRGTRALVLPSWYEGFGLPLLEAMACGAPILSSNRTSLPEIGGDAVRYFDPGQPESLVEGLRKFEVEEGSDTLRDKGFKRAKAFNWNQVAMRIRAELDARGHGPAEATL